MNRENENFNIPESEIKLTPKEIARAAEFINPVEMEAKTPEEIKKLSEQIASVAALIKGESRINPDIPISRETMGRIF